jgi:ribonuclease HII
MTQLLHVPRQMPRSGPIGEGSLVCGIDEVGRGAWAGPLVVGAALGDPSQIAPLLRRTAHGSTGPYTDSKALSPSLRSALAVVLRGDLRSIGLGVVGVAEIDQLGMAQALRVGCARALSQLGEDHFSLEIDGPSAYVPAERASSTTAIIGGDSHSPLIAAASIVAKVYRDQLMVDADDSFPMFDFASNKGYPSPSHRRALMGWGPSTFHRVSWKPFGDLLYRHPELLEGRRAESDHRGGLRG